MQQYLDLLQHIVTKGEDTTDRTGVGTRSVFGYQMRFDLREGQIPLMTTKKIPFRVILEELLWFLRGDTQLRSLLKVNVHIWDEWPFKWYLQSTGKEIPQVNGPEWNHQLKEFTNRILTDDEFNAEFGNLGPVYGYQWRSWPGAKGNIDQIQQVLDTLKNSPDSRRNMVLAWNPDQIDEMAKAGLPPCHCLFQFKVINGKLSCQLYQRSCDTFLGVPFNIASYALLTIMVARASGLTPHEFIWTGGDVHLYKNHFGQVVEQLNRTPHKLPRIEIDPDAPDGLFDFEVKHFKLIDYNPEPSISAPIAV